MNKDFNVISGIRIIESLKAEVVCEIGNLYKLLTRGTNIAHNSILESISNLIISLYILGERLGYSYKKIDSMVVHKLDDGIKGGDVIEKQDESLSNLKNHIINSRKN